ncbi:M15 family metallopeptidase [Roseomonas acroporae]|nr:D-alanyl-D-alanine carboxypeptidase family protein [Roseomonas acroporae]
MAQGGQALEQGAARLDQAAAGLDRMAREQIQQETVNRRTTQLAGMVTSLAELETQVEQQRDPDGVRNTWKQGVARLRQAAVDGAGNEDDRTWIGAQFDQQAAGRLRWVEGQARGRARDSGLALLGEAERAQSRNADMARSPEGRQAAIMAFDAAVAGQLAAGNIGQDDAQRLRTRFAGSVEFLALNRLVGDDPHAGLRALSDPRLTGNLSPEQRLRLEDRGQAGVLRLEQQAEAAQRRAEADMNRRERRALVALGEWNALAAQGIVPADRAAQTLELARGTDAEPLVRATIANARLTDQFRMAPLPQQREMFAAAQERIRAGAASDADLAVRDRMRATAQQQREGYATDGLGQAVRDGLVRQDEIPPLNLADPSTINQRTALAQRVMAARGRPVSALSSGDLQEITRQFVQSQADPALATRVIATVNGIQDPAVRQQTIEALEKARGDAGRMPRGSIAVIADLARGDASQQRAAMELTQQLTSEADDRVRRAGEAPQLRSAMERVFSDPRMQVARAAGTLIGREGRAGTNRLDAYADMVQGVAQRLVAQGETPDRAVSRAMDTVFAGSRPVVIPGVATMTLQPGMESGDGLRRGLVALRDGWIARLPTDVSSGRTADQLAINREVVRNARNGEWVDFGQGQYAFVGEGERGIRGVLFTATADQINEAARRGVTQGLIGNLGTRTGAQRIEGWDLPDPPRPAAPAPPATPGPRAAADPRNGNLPDTELVSIGGNHRLAPAVAPAYQQMVAEARAAGFDLAPSDSYRTLDQQRDLAARKGRYSQGGFAAEPGHSRHGLGEAVDLGERGPGGQVRPLTPQAVAWLQANAGRFGFETIPREPWHWQFRGQQVAGR